MLHIVDATTCSCPAAPLASFSDLISLIIIFRPTTQQEEIIKGGMDTTAVASAMQSIEAFKVNDAKDALRASFDVIVTAIPTACGATLKNASLSMCKAVALDQTLWETCHASIAENILLSARVDWTVRAFVAKKVLPMLLQGQCGWDGAAAVQRRTKALADTCFKAILVPNPHPTEVRIYVDLLVGFVSTAPNAVAQGVTASIDILRAVLPPILATGKAPATFLCGLEESLCAESVPEGIRSVGLSLLPPAFEGKGSSAVKAVVHDAINAANNNAEGTTLSSVSERFKKIIENAGNNATALQRALTGPSAVQSLLNALSHHATDSTSSEEKLDCWRTLTMILVFSVLNHSEVAELLACPLNKKVLNLVEGCCRPSCSVVEEGEEVKPTLGEAPDAASVEEIVEGGTDAPVPAEPSPLKASQVESSLAPAALQDSLLDVDMTVTECKLLVLKKLTSLLQSSSSSGGHTPILEEYKANLGYVCKEGLVPLLTRIRSKVDVALTVLQKKSRGNKRDREDPSPDTAVEGDGMDLRTCQQCNAVLSSVFHLSRYFAEGVDKKITPSWHLQS